VAIIYENILQIFLMFVLLGCSAFFSGAETAFFNLSRRQILLLAESKHALHRLAAGLLHNPKELLGGLLFANCAVNICFYSLATVLAFELGSGFGRGAGAITAAAAFTGLVLFGEMLPKSLAYANSKRFCTVAALPSLLVVRVLWPIQFIFNFLIVEPTLRLLLAPARKTDVLNPAQLKLLIESSRHRGLITADENQLLSAVVEFGFLKVRHVMRPRVDMATCDINTTVRQAEQLMTAKGLTKLPVYSHTIDNLVGLVHLRDVLLRPQASLDKLVREVNFVPEQKTVESLLEFFRRRGTDIAIVVDEYGGISGCVYVEDIVGELLGPVEPTTSIEPVTQIGPMKYRLAGGLAIHDWAEAFGIDIAQSRFSTIGGLVTAFLGRIPRSGDTAYLRNLKFTVEKMRKHRVETVILSLESVNNES